MSWPTLPGNGIPLSPYVVSVTTSTVVLEFRKYKNKNPNYIFVQPLHLANELLKYHSDFSNSAFEVSDWVIFVLNCPLGVLAFFELKVV